MSRLERSWLLLVLNTLLICCVSPGRRYDEAIAITGATPLALAREVPADMSLSVDGRVKKEFHFTYAALRAHATTRMRTREVGEQGRFLGAYIYYGIPVFNILEGVAPDFPPGAVFDRPLDMVVVFTSRSEKKVRFSYGELTMTDDRFPVTLAFRREPILPAKDAEDYNLNLYTKPLTGLRLIAPRDVDTRRYLDDVVRMTLEVLESPDKILPEMRKAVRCGRETLLCVQEGRSAVAEFAGIPLRRTEDWIRIGHGRGFKGISRVEGYPLRSFLRKNFAGMKEEDFFLFVACDGYRCLFSAREIFATEDGDTFLLIEDSEVPAHKEYRLAPVADFFVDRSVWGLSYIFLLSGGEREVRPR